MSRDNMAQAQFGNQMERVTWTVDSVVLLSTKIVLVMRFSDQLEYSVCNKNNSTTNAKSESTPPIHVCFEICLLGFERMSKLRIY